MYKITVILIIIFSILALNSCDNKEKQPSDMNIVFLHHSTGKVIWNGKSTSLFTKLLNRIKPGFSKAQVPSIIEKYNNANNKNYQITEMIFPKASPYGWNNYPYDYYNIWVKHGGDSLYQEEPTLELLTKEYQLIIFKHCFPVSNILPDQDSADLNSDVSTIANYKLQYNAIKEKLHSFPNTKFILFTGAVQVKKYLTEEEAIRAKEFYIWVKDHWDEPNDNIHLWDLYTLQTEGDLYFKNHSAVSLNDSHPNADFAGRVAPLLCNRIIDVIENDGKKTMLAGEKK